MSFEVTGQVVVGSQRRVEGAGERVEDTIFVDVPGLADLANDRGLHRIDAPGSLRLAEARVEHRPEPVDQQADQPGVRNEDVLHVILRERQAELLQVFRITADQRCLAPVEFGTQYQAIQAIVFGVAGQDLHEAFFEPLRCLFHIDVRTAFVAEVEHLDPELLAILQREFIRVFGVYLQTHAFQDRQGVRKRQRLIGTENNEMQES